MTPDTRALQNYVAGRFVDSNASEFITFYNPAFAEPLGRVPVTPREEVSAAVDAALSGFETIRRMPATERVKLLLRIRGLMERDADKLARVLVDNHGRTYSEGLGEVRRSIENVESAAALAYTYAKGENMLNVSPDVDQTLIREPLGVFAIITPFNIPLHAWSSYVPYAIALGCSIVLKPSEVTPLISNEIFRIMHEAGVPEGVVNLVHGGPSVVEQLVKHREVKGVGFIGSTRTGRLLYRMAAEEGKRASINAGAKNYIVVMPDADREKTVGALVSSFFGMCGQRCLAGSNLVLVGGNDELLSRFVEASNLRLGYGMDSDVDMGPLVSASALERVRSYVERGEAEGAKLLLDGRKNRPAKPLKGYFIGPTIFADVSPDMAIAREEIFGPVASVITCEKLDEAIEYINKKTPYGNAAAIFTSNAREARRFALEVDVGNVGINVGIPQPMAYFPIGGRRESFFGGAHSRVDTIRFFTDHKIIVSRWQ